MPSELPPIPSQSLTVPAPTFSRLIPIGPASLPLTPKETETFARDTQRLLKKAQQKCTELGKALEGLGRGAGTGAVEQSELAKKAVERRYSVQSIVDETTRITSDPSAVGDLRFLLRKRWAPVEGISAPKARGRKRKREATEDAEAVAEEMALGQGEAPEGEEQAQVDEDAALKLVEEVDRIGPSFLRAPPPKIIEPYLHKARKPDYNSLNTVRPAASPPLNVDRAKPTASPDPLANLVYTLVFHPISRYTIAGVGRARHRIYQTPQRQVLICLGSTTLEEVMRELQAGKEKVPKEATPEVSSDEEDGDADEEEEEQVGFQRGQPTMMGNIGGARKEKKQKRVRWKQEASRTGSVFCVEDVLYADGEVDEEPGKKDYAQMVLDLVQQTDWPTSTSPPQLQTGSSMQETKLGDLETMRVRQPYWFLTGGNVEVVWSVEEIRYRHPLDPNPTSATSSHPYPLTTFLSRPSHSSTSSLSSSASASATAARCRVCDRDPGAFILLDDELVGETPALVCEKCLDALHPRKEDGEQEEEEDEGADELERGRLRACSEEVVQGEVRKEDKEESGAVKYAYQASSSPSGFSTTCEPAKANFPQCSFWGGPASGSAQDYQQPAFPVIHPGAHPLTPPLSIAGSTKRSTKSPSPPLSHRFLPPDQPFSQVTPYEPIKLEPVRLWLGRLAVGTRKRDILQLFAKEQIAVLDAEVRTRFEPAYAFVTVSSPAMADLAISLFHRSYQLDVFLRVERALPVGFPRIERRLPRPIVEVYNLPISFDNVDLLTLARRFVDNPKEVMCEAGERACRGSFTVRDGQAAKAAVDGLNAAVVAGRRLRASCGTLPYEAEEGEIRLFEPSQHEGLITTGLYQHSPPAALGAVLRQRSALSLASTSIGPPYHRPPPAEPALPPQNEQLTPAPPFSGYHYPYNPSFPPFTPGPQPSSAYPCPSPYMYPPAAPGYALPPTHAYPATSLSNPPHPQSSGGSD
ncbi:hypothetical protein JCM11251_000155 [Rhodosporidiobolus azoricus]